MNKAFVTILVPVYGEEDIIYENIKTISRIMDETDVEYGFMLVDDGSSDGTWSEISKLRGEMDCIKAIRLSRNFGKEAAICAGLERAIGDAVVIIDGDLQHPPEKIPFMLEKWKEGYEVVDGVKESRGREKKGSKFSAGLFYGLLNRLSGINLRNASDFKLMDRKVLDAWCRLPERDTFFRGMSFWLGFRRTEIKFNVAQRNGGKSKWSIKALVRLAATAITSFSTVPLQIVTFLGFMFLIGSAILGIHTLYMKFSGAAVSGFTTVILLLLILGSALMISLGIIGIYISRIYDEVKQRPRYLVSDEIK